MSKGSTTPVRRTLLDSLFRHERIDGPNRSPYLHRWTLISLGRGRAVYLHHFVGDDWARDHHDHPKRFVSIGLWGRYVEEAPITVNPTVVSAALWRAPWVRSFPATHRHRIRLVPGYTCWTLCLVGHETRPWGFWVSGRWVPWQSYLHDARRAAKEVS